MRGVRRPVPLALIAIFLWASIAGAEGVRVAAVSGRVDHLGGSRAEWLALRPDSEVRAQDQIRSGARGWARLLLDDGSLVIVGPGSLLRIEEVTLAAPRSRVLVRLLGGELRVVTGGGYPAQGRFEIETPTAMVTTPGTQFLVTYDTDAAETRVVSLDGTTEVAGLLGVLGRPVMVAPRAKTDVRKGAFPDTPSPMPGEALSALQARSSLMISADDTLLAGFTGAQTKAVAEAAPSEEVAEEETEIEGAPASGGPRRMRRRWMSRDAEAIDQSVPEFMLTPAGQSPAGSVTVVISGG